MKDYKGSRKCVLDLIESDSFLRSINSLISKSKAIISENDVWKPESHINDKEAKLNTFLSEYINKDLGRKIHDWWLDIKKGANTPNWDFVSTCSINNQKGLLLIEAKAHYKEFKSKGKKLNSGAKENTKKNHEKIGQAIRLANNFLKLQFPDISISRDNCYQLSNRIAYAWWLASHGIPVVLLYLGFLNVTDMDNGNNHLFLSNEDWLKCFKDHASIIGVDILLDKWVNCNKNSFILIANSIEV